MAQRNYLILGLVAVLALAIAGTFMARELGTTSAATTTGTMAMTVSAGGTCEASKCQVAASGAFTLRISVVEELAGGYIGIQTELDYAQLVANGGNYKPGVVADESTWPQSAFPLRSPGMPTGLEGLINHADATGVVPPFPISHHEGSIIELAFNCGPSGSNVFTLVPLHDRTMAPFFRELGFREEPLLPLGREL